jgi:hypothetical protein
VTDGVNHRRRWRGIIVAALITVPAAGPEARGAEPPARVPPARVNPRAGDEAAGALQLEILQQALGDGLRALVDPANARREQQMARAQAEAEAVQQKQQAKQVEQMLQPVIRTELEQVRQSCGSLSPEARRTIAEAARETASEVAAVWVGRQERPNGASFDAREQLHAGIVKVVEPLADPLEFAAYRREAEARLVRRDEAARVRIVAKVDEQLDLTADQREAILVDLRNRWQPEWIRELHDTGGIVVNGHRPAPDYAGVCIAPHLDAEQREAWSAWTRVAGFRHVNVGPNMRFDGHGLQQDDEWWKP